jgi:hypothetical protein
MFRLLIYGTLFGAGLWAGTEVQRFQMVNACLDAGGSIDARGFCDGASPDG